jgi:magnesium and cobalt transporter
VESKKFNLKRLLRKHIVAPHSMKLIDLLTQMQRSRTHIAIVVDEYGGTDGLVTIEDIIEEIVGNIDDEHDIGIDEDYRILKPGLIITSARVEIQELENVLGTQLSSVDDEFDTIGGLIMVKSGSVPEKGEVIHITEDIIAEILEATPRTIKQIKITYTAK